MAFSMQYLMEQSPTMFYNRLKERSMGFNSKGKKTSTNKQQIYANTNTTFAEIIRELELMQDKKGRILHPKMIKLRNVLSDHFDQHQANHIHNAEAYETSGHDVFGCTPKSGELANFSSTSQADTRVMVFCSYRECCDEIVSYLNDSGFKATEFVGQSKAKSGKKGMSQKDQERVIADFKAGKYNVLVATSIGEEGLDIGSVDLTVCYEAVKDSIRMLQRIGRTGRKREGKIVVLVSEGREQHNWQHSKDNYKAVQKEVDSRLHVELFDDVDRMVPDGISPQPVLKEVEQPEFDPSMISDGRQARAPRAKKEPKPKKDPKRNMPEGGDIVQGFRKASSLAKLKRRQSGSNGDSDQSDSPPIETHSQKMKRLLNDLDDDFDTDLEKENLSLDLRTSRDKAKAATKRIASSPSSSPPPQLQRTMARSSASSSICTPPLPDSISTPPLGSLQSTSSSSRPLAAAGASTRGKKLGVGLRSSGRSTSSAGTLSLRKSGDLPSSSANGPSSSGAPGSLLDTVSPRSRGIATTPKSLGDDDDEFDFGDFPINKSLEEKMRHIEAAAATKKQEEENARRNEAAAAAKRQVDRASYIDPEILNPPFLEPLREELAQLKREGKLPEPSTPPAKRGARVKPDPIMVALIKEEEEKERMKAQQSTSKVSRSSPKVLSSPMKGSMGPPDSIPRRAGGTRAKGVILESPDGPSGEAEPMDEDAEPASSSPIKVPAKRRGRLQKASSMPNVDTSPTAQKSKPTKRAKFSLQSDDDDDGDAPLAAAARTKGKSKAKTGKKAVSGSGVAKKKRKITNSPTSRALFQYEAERSTDEEVHRERDEDDSGLGSSDEDDSDREAVGDFMPTQAPRGYHQQSIYMQSIMSQRAPEEFQRVRHAPFPGVGGRFGLEATPRSVRRARVPSSEGRAGRGGEEEDRYSEDSFVVNDEDEIVYDSDEDGLPDSSQF